MLEHSQPQKDHSRAKGKEEWIEEQSKNTEKEMKSGNSKEAYNTLKTLPNTQQYKSAVIEDGSGNILTKSELF